MDHEFPDDDLPLAPEWWAPLQEVVQSVAGVERHRFLAIEDFMMMARIRRSPRPSITLYKHVFTRRYLNVDASGQTYRYIARRDPLSPSMGRYVRSRSLDDALDSLRLWELPWMKAGLELERCGLDWDERHQLRDALERGESLASRQALARSWRRARYEPTPFDEWADGCGDGRHLRAV